MSENEELTQYEKMIEGISQFAMLIYAYYSALIENGFSRKDALVLTIEYQRQILQSVKPNG